MKITTVVLAAGLSSRSPNHKLLATFDGIPLVRLTVINAIEAGSDRVIAVTGHRHEEILAAIGDLKFETVHNLDNAGMGSSLRTGAEAAMADDPDGIMIALADMPRLTAAHFRRLIDVYGKSDGRRIVRAFSGEQPGHPVIFPPCLYGSLLQLRDDMGARNVIDARGAAVIAIDLGAAATMDVDTSEEVYAAGGRWAVSVS